MQAKALSALTVVPVKEKRVQTKGGCIHTSSVPLAGAAVHTFPLFPDTDARVMPAHRFYRRQIFVSPTKRFTWELLSYMNPPIVRCISPTSSRSTAEDIYSFCMMLATGWMYVEDTQTCAAPAKTLLPLYIGQLSCRFLLRLFSILLSQNSPMLFRSLSKRPLGSPQDP